jgi:hypothetical protein
MSGGVAYVYDPEGNFERRCNTAMVTLEPVIAAHEQENKVARSGWHSARRGTEISTDEAILKGLLEAHFRHTGSFRAREILTHWGQSRKLFVKVFPNEYRRALAEMYANRLDELGPTLVHSDVDHDNPSKGSASWPGRAAATAVGRTNSGAPVGAVASADTAAGTGAAVVTGAKAPRKGARVGGGGPGKVPAARQR